MICSLLCLKSIKFLLKQFLPLPLCDIIREIYNSEGTKLGLKLSDIEPNSNIKLQISSGKKHIDMDAIIKRHIKDDISVIDLCYESDYLLNFENVKIEVIYTTKDGTPYIWRTARIVNHKSKYILQAKNEGIRYNRRNTFRVGISTSGRLNMANGSNKTVTVRDISLTGFSITDRSNELGLDIGNAVDLYFEDIGHVLDLAGTLVRVEVHEDKVIYGFKINNLCKDLPSYVSTKQRQKRR